MDPASYNNFSAPGSSPVPMSQQPVISSGGDIILQSEKPKKRKGLVILLVVLVVLIIGLVAAFYFVNKNRQSGFGANEQAQEAFNRYANFLLYGEDKNTVVSDSYNASKIYYVQKSLSDKDQGKNNIQYFEDLESKHLDFSNKISDKEKQDLTDAGEIIDVYEQVLYFILAYVRYNEITIDDLLLSYGQGGEVAIQELMVGNITFSEYINKSAIARKYFDIVEQINLINSDLVLLAAKDQCIKDGEIDYVCLNNDFEAKDKINMLSKLYGQRDELYVNSRANIVSFCWDIFDVLGIRSKQ